MTQNDLVGVIGNAGTLLLEGTSDTGEPWYVWSCWEVPPRDLERIVETASDFLVDGTTPDSLRAEFLCGPDNPRRKTGTPMSLEAPYPEGHPLGKSD